MDAQKLVYLSQLYDLYHPLLTDKQRTIAEATFSNDLSLSEIADALSITRSGVQDHLQKAIQKLEDAENALGFLKRVKVQESLIDSLESTELTAKQQALIDQLKDVM